MKDEAKKQMDENALHKKLGNIRKELKCWESMFVRGNGRKPTKDDIESTGSEIRATYKEYAILKDQLNKLSKVTKEEEGETNSNCENEQSQNVEAKSNSAAADDDDDVFGKSLNKSRNKIGKTTTPSHLKEQSLARKPKFSFTQRKHLKAPFRNEQKTENSVCPTDSSQNEQKVDSQVHSEQEIFDTQSKAASDKDNQSEDTLRENDFLGSGALGNFQITSNSADRGISCRKFTKVSKRKSVSGRNGMLSKEWLEKLKPREESNKVEEMFQNENFDDQMENIAEPRNVDNEDIFEGSANDGVLQSKTENINVNNEDIFEGPANDGYLQGKSVNITEPRNNHVNNEDIFEVSANDGGLQSTGKGTINKTSNIKVIHQNYSYDEFDNNALPYDNVTIGRGSETSYNFEDIVPSVNWQDPVILQNETSSGITVTSIEPNFVENKTSFDVNSKNKDSDIFNDVECSSISAKSNAAVVTLNCEPSPYINVKINSSQEHKTKHTRMPIRTSKLYDNRGNVVEARTNDSMREGHSGSNPLKLANKEIRAKKQEIAKSVQQKRKKVVETELENATDGKEEHDCAPREAKRAKKESAADIKAIAKVPRGKRLVSENFVKIDIQKKRFCRGKRKIKASTYKRQQWKKKTQFNAKSTTKCYKCGSDGHWAKDCGKRSTKGNPARFSSFDGKKTEDFLPVHSSEDVPGCSGFFIEDVPELQRPWPRIPYHPPRPAAPVGALYEPVDGQPSDEAFKEINKALRSLGYTSFRTGQEMAIARIVSGLSTLLVLSTGSGKSLCYQLPAYLYYKKAKCLTIVISPLVALMEDQVGNLPYGLKGACLHANMTKPQREKVMKDVTDGKIAILLLSPEALVSGSTSTGYLPMLGSLPPIAFACIDEAHCVSEWSHNFRPNYLRVCKVLRDILGVHCFLGLTATSTKATSISITKHLGIDEAESENAIIRGPTMPDNLHITVSKDEDRDQALVSLLSGERFHKCTSIIVYCTRREETERLSAILRTCLHNLPPTELDVDGEEDKDTPKPKAKRKGKGSRKPKLRTVAWDADSYHAGMTPAHRRRVQKRFMSGELRIVVATTAFGMGLDKADVRAIIHYNMPKSFESYLQEIGRAGRDGLPAHCHVFIDEEAKDLCELRRHTYSNSVDMKSIKRLVNRVFKSCDCKARALAAEASKQMQCHDDAYSDNGAKGHGDSCLVNSDKSVQRESEEIVMDDELMKEYFADDFDVESLDEIRPNPEKKRQQVSGPRVATEHDTASTDIVADSPKISSDSGSVGGTCQPDIEARTSTKNSESSSTTCQTSINQEDGHLDSDEPPRYCVGHHVTFSIEQTVQDLDMPEENISTLLSYLELHPESAVTLHNPIKSRCTVQCYGGARQMKLLALKFLPLTAVFNSMRRNELKLADAKAVTFNAVEIADEMGWDLDPIYRELRSVQWSTQFAVNQGDSLVGKSGVMVEFDDQSFHVISQGDLSHDERDHICGILHKMVQEQEKTRLLQLDALYNILSKNSHGMYHDIVSNTDPSADKQLRESIQEYFECRPSEMRALLKKLSPEKIEIPVPECKWNAISRDIRTMLGLHHDVIFSGRALARIFHGIDSPCYPAVVWGRDRRFWRRYLDVDFNDLRMFITDEIIKYRT